MSQINNIEDLRNKLVSIYDKVEKDEMDLKTAKTLVAASNSILKTSKQQLDNREYMQGVDEIDFFKVKKK